MALPLQRAHSASSWAAIRFLGPGISNLRTSPPTIRGAFHERAKTSRRNKKRAPHRKTNRDRHSHRRRLEGTERNVTNTESTNGGESHAKELENHCHRTNPDSNLRQCLVCPSAKEWRHTRACFEIRSRNGPPEVLSR